MKNLSFANDSVYQIWIAVKLVLNDVVEHFQEKEHQMMIAWVAK